MATQLRTEQITDDVLWMRTLQTMQSVFETMAFAEVTPCTLSHGCEAKTFYWSEIEIDAPDFRSVELAIPQSGVMELVQAMYGEVVDGDTCEETKEKIILDVIAELSNVITGSFLIECYNEEGMKYRLSLPKTKKGLPDFQANTVTCYCAVEDISPVIVNINRAVVEPDE